MELEVLHPSKLTPFTDDQVREMTRSPKLDAFEAMLSMGDPVECPIVMRKTPGCWSREFRGPAGAMIASKIHRTEHQFILSQGRVRVWTEGQGTVELVAPYHGITTAATRRALLVLEPIIWTTFHPSDADTLELLEQEVILPHEVCKAFKPSDVDELLGSLIQ